MHHHEDTTLGSQGGLKMLMGSQIDKEGFGDESPPFLTASLGVKVMGVEELMRCGTGETPLAAILPWG